MPETNIRGQTIITLLVIFLFFLCYHAGKERGKQYVRSQIELHLDEGGVLVREDLNHLPEIDDGPSDREHTEF